MDKIKCIECGEEKDDCDEDGLCEACFDEGYEYEEDEDEEEDEE